MSQPINVDDVVAFAEKHSGRVLYTLAHHRPFTLQRRTTGIRITLPTGTYLPANRKHIKKYLAYYTSAPPKMRRKTTIYKNGLREGSYMARVFFEIEKERALKGEGANGLEDLGIDSSRECRAGSSILHGVDCDSRSGGATPRDKDGERTM